MNTKATAEQVAAFFNAPVENVKRQYARNAVQLRQCQAQAKAGKYRGYTNAQWNAFAKHAETQSLP